MTTPDTTDEQIDCLAKIYTGQLGGNPWAILGTTFEVAGLVKAAITTEGSGLTFTLKADGVGQGSGDTFKNPVTGEPHEAHIVPSDRQDYAYSVLIDKTAAQDRAQSDPILDAMGMLPGSVISSPDANSSAHYLLILGYDYEPCFSPEKLGQ